MDIERLYVFQRFYEPILFHFEVTVPTERARRAP
jgi:hypothetical protein